LEAVDRAISLVESAAADAAYAATDAAYAAADAAYAATDAAAAAYAAAADADDADSAAADAARGAYAAARLCTTAARAAADDDNDVAAYAVTDAAGAAGKAADAAFAVIESAAYDSYGPEERDAAFSSKSVGLSVYVKANRRDFTRLSETSKQHGWTDKTPVPLEVFGPMWPDGEPEGWPKATQPRGETRHIDEVSPPLISILWDPEVVTEEEYADLVEALGNVVRAHGGAGLKRIDATGFGVEIEAGVRL
jgi:hypothetical protein